MPFSQLHKTILRHTRQVCVRLMEASNCVHISKKNQDKLVEKREHKFMEFWKLNFEFMNLNGRNTESNNEKNR